MFLHLTNVLTADEVAQARTLLGEDAPWRDGQASASGGAQAQKRNAQLDPDSAQAQQLRALVLTAVQRDPLFLSAALPARVFNPLFNRYEGQANAYGLHTDAALLHSRHPAQWVRSDLSCTLFLSDPADYDGGELCVQDGAQERRFKLPAGDLLLYPGHTLHQVLPVTRGTRLASFFWVQSLVRSPEQRALLWDMDMALVRLRQALGEDHPEIAKLNGTYHHLLRMWATP